MNVRLKAARETSGKTQLEVAKETGIKEVSYQRYEYGERVPNAIIISRIAKVLNTTVEALYGESTKALDGNQVKSK